MRRSQPRSPLVGAAVLLAAVLVLLPVALGGCGGGQGKTDTNEPNDELPNATKLLPGEVRDGVIGTNDSDIFRCATPSGSGSHDFVVTVKSKSPEGLQLQVGASIPGVWEGITWPGWKPVATGDRVEVAGSLHKGTILMFLKGTPGVEYSIAIVWK